MLLGSLSAAAQSCASKPSSPPFFGFAAVRLGSACAKIEIKKTSDLTYTDGLRFFRSEPYLLVTVDKEGNAQTSIIALPNKKQDI